MGASSAWSIKTSKPRDSNLTLMEFTSWREYSASRKLPSGEHLPGVVERWAVPRITTFVIVNLILRFINAPQQNCGERWLMCYNIPKSSRL